MTSEHRARVVPFSAAPEDTFLMLMVECFECPPQPLRWGYLRDTQENVIRLEGEATRHNCDYSKGRFSSSSESDGTITSTTDESEKP